MAPKAFARNMTLELEIEQILLNNEGIYMTPKQILVAMVKKSKAMAKIVSEEIIQQHMESIVDSYNMHPTICAITDDRRIMMVNCKPIMNK